MSLPADQDATSIMDPSYTYSYSKYSCMAGMYTAHIVSGGARDSRPPGADWSMQQQPAAAPPQQAGSSVPARPPLGVAAGHPPTQSALTRRPATTARACPLLR
jgi:hypothetical protein